MEYIKRWEFWLAVVVVAVVVNFIWARVAPGKGNLA
jgi:hypothetical protein